MLRNRTPLRRDVLALAPGQFIGDILPASI